MYVYIYTWRELKTISIYLDRFLLLVPFRKRELIYTYISIRNVSKQRSCDVKIEKIHLNNSNTVPIFQWLLML